MDVVTAIMNDHRVLEGLFEELTSNRRERAVLVAEVRARLSAHSNAEERYVYSALRRLVPSESGEVRHGVEEHREAEEKLAAVLVAPVTEFPGALGEFIAVVRHHVDEEESEILPALKAAMSIRKRDELGRRFESHRIKELRRVGIDDSLTKEDLYIRSSMSKDELARALLAARVGGSTRN